MDSPQRHRGTESASKKGSSVEERAVGRELSEAEVQAIKHRHAYHKPASGEVQQRHARVREILATAEIELMKILPEKSRGTSLVATKLDEARMWANQAIATSQ